MRLDRTRGAEVSLRHMALLGLTIAFRQETETAGHEADCQSDIPGLP
jgi:hypothetical protein